jgi:hypothetical protein
VSYGKVKLLVAATYTVAYDDAEGGAPTYTITTTPTRGTLISTGLGIFAYASTSLGAPDSFCHHGERRARRDDHDAAHLLVPAGGRSVCPVQGPGPVRAIIDALMWFILSAECVDDGSRPAGRSEATRSQYRDRQGGRDDEA